MGMNIPNLECRMYKANYPEIDIVVMIKVKKIAEMAAYVSLLEFNNIEGMIQFLELSRHRIRGVYAVRSRSKDEPMMVLRVIKEARYIDLSRRRVSEEDILSCVERYKIEEQAFSFHHAQRCQDFAS